MGLEVGGGGTEKEEEKETEKIPLCESIGHRPLRGRCPSLTLNYNHNLPKQGTGTADHLMLLRLFHIPLSNLFQTKPISCLSLIHKEIKKQMRCTIKDLIKVNLSRLAICSFAYCGQRPIMQAHEI